MVGCPSHIKCPTDKYCAGKKFTPIKTDIPQILSLKEREESSLRKMKQFNSQRRKKGVKKPPYKPIYTNKSKKIWNENDLGHIYGYACYPSTEANKKFKIDNSSYTVAFGVATKECKSTDSDGNIILGKEHLRNRQNRNACYSKVIEREISKEAEVSGI